MLYSSEIIAASYGFIGFCNSLNYHLIYFR